MCNELTKIAIQNLEILDSLGNNIDNYQLIIDGNKLSIPEDTYDGLFNLKEFENPIFFAYNQVFNSIRYSNLYKLEDYKTKELIELMDSSIDRIAFIADEMEIQIVNKIEKTFEDTVTKGISIDYEKLAREIGKQQFGSQDIGTSKILWSINPLGMITGGMSFISREKYIKNNWTFMNRINYFSYRSGDFSSFINDDNKKMNVQAVGIGFSSTKYFTNSSSFRYNGLSSSINFDLFYVNTKRSSIESYENTDGDYWKNDQINSLAFSVSGAIGASYNIYGSLNIKPMLGISFLYLVHLDEKATESVFAPMPVLNISYLY